MRTKLFAISGILAAAMTATIAVGNWTTLPFAVGPVVVDQNKNVSVDFVNATASEVLSWLKKSGVNFVIETEDVPQDKRLTVHIKNQPMDKAIEAIADALGLNWTKKGNIYTLRNGGSGNWSAFQDLKVLGDQDGKVWRISPEDSKKWEQFGKEMGEKFKGFEPKVYEWSEGDAKKWEQFGKEMGEKFKGFEPKAYEWKTEDGKVKVVKPEEFEKLMQERMKDFKFKALDEKQLEKLKELHKFEMKDFPEGKFEFKALPKMDLKLKELEKLDGEVFKRLKDLPDMKKIEVGLGDIGRLVKSLTPEQLEKNKARGYLTLDDLTPEQRKMLGDWGKDADFKIMFERDGKSVTIKGK